jgi:hypothetical protein
MPEIKNNFTQGRMNKDFDEKLVPKGQYLHALNMQMASKFSGSTFTAGEGSLSAILGNKSVESVISNGHLCVGSIADEAKNKLYWFVKQNPLVAGNNFDKIIEYDQNTNSSTIVFQDTDFDVLKFPNKLITGINIIDDFLFWTDGSGEPKKISISRSIEGSAGGGQTQLIVNGVSLGKCEEENITVIKRKPNKAPDVRVNTSLEEDSSTGLLKNVDPLFEKIFPRFACRYKYVDGEYSAISPFTDVIFNSKYFDDLNNLNAYSFKDPYNLIMVNCIESIELCNFVPYDIPKDVVQVDLLYMQENSSVVYSIVSVKKTDAEWSLYGHAEGGYLNTQGKLNIFDIELDPVSGTASYIVGHKGRYRITAENIHAALPENQLLRNYDNVPKKAQAQEITGSRIVYANYTQNYDIVDVSNTEFNPTVSSTYSLRNNNPTETFSHGGLRSLKSQRDYQVGVVFGDKYGRETPVFTSSQASLYIPWTSPFGSGLNASESLIIQSRITSQAPVWADYYKFFIKQTSGEYYNLVMDKAYSPPTHIDFENEDDHIWISFPSTDRSKISVDDYIILKKILGTASASQVPFENKYKVVDIKNEVPDSISYHYKNLGTAINAGDIFTDDTATFNGGLELLFPNASRRMDRADGNDLIVISAERWTGTDDPLTGGPTTGNYNNAPLTVASAFEEGSNPTEEFKDLYVTWSVNGQSSTRYRINSIKLVEDTNHYQLKLSEAISQTDAELCLPAGTAYTPGAAHATLHQDLIFQIQRKERRDAENFSGKFFVKIHGDNIIRQNIFEDQQATAASSYVTGSFECFRFMDVVSSNYFHQGQVTGLSGQINSNSNSSSVTGNTTTAGIVPSDIANHSGENITQTLSDWEAILAANNNEGFFFLDQMGMVASNPSSQSFAKESGQGWAGAWNSSSYSKQIWAPIGYVSWDNPNSFMELDWGPAYEDQGLNVFGVGSQSVSGQYGGYTGEIRLTVDNVGTVNYGNFPTGSFGVPTPYASSNINSLEGAITTTLVHTADPQVNISGDGARRWKDNSLYNNNLDTTYGPVGSTGKHFIHVSFLAPGEDLHDGAGLNGTYGNNTAPSIMYFRGKTDSFPSRMQGIHGGGWFTNAGTNGQIDSGDVFGDSNDGIICFEGNWADQGSRGPVPGNVEMMGWWEEPSVAPSGQGYDSAFANRHINQWDPTKTTSATANAKAQVFIDNIINNIGGKFRFQGDTEEYQILSISEKHIYNHTPWRKRIVPTDIQTGWASDNISVEEAALNWANTHGDADLITGVNTTYAFLPFPTGATGTKGGQWNPLFANNFGGLTSTIGWAFPFENYGRTPFIWPMEFGYAPTNNAEFDTLCDKIVEFGRASNRRTCYIIELDKDITSTGNHGAFGSAGFDINDFMNIEVVSANSQIVTGEIVKNPAIWETEPREQTELNIYHEASEEIPLELTMENIERFAPIGSRVEFPNMVYSNIQNFDVHVNQILYSSSPSHLIQVRSGNLITNSNGIDVHPDEGFNWFDNTGNLIDYVGEEIRFYRDDGTYTSAIVKAAEDYFHGSPADILYWSGASTNLNNGQGYRVIFQLEKSGHHNLDQSLDHTNAFTFGDGVETSRIRDGFNEMKITNGPKASATLETPYEEEERKHGLIYSGIYNSNSGINNLNQFIAAEKITKDVNPTYGSITKLFSRKADLVTLCEDKILKILANKDAVFNADGNPQLVASENVLGQAIPFVGDYGCQDASSFAYDSFRSYFVDKQRGAVLRLSMDGLTPISDAGMSTYFKGILNQANFILGTYDNNEEEYNVTWEYDSPYSGSFNFLFNSYLDYGVDLYTTSVPDPIQEDGGVYNGSYFYYDVNGGLAESVSNFESQVIIRNWPSIDQGYINPGQVAQPAQPLTPAVYTEGLFDVYSADFSAYNLNSEPEPGYVTGTVGGDQASLFVTGIGDGNTIATATREIAFGCNDGMDYAGIDNGSGTALVGDVINAANGDFIPWPINAGVLSAWPGDSYYGTYSATNTTTGGSYRGVEYTHSYHTFGFAPYFSFFSINHIGDLPVIAQDFGNVPAAMTGLNVGSQTDNKPGIIFQGLRGESDDGAPDKGRITFNFANQNLTSPNATPGNLRDIDSNVQPAVNTWGPGNPQNNTTNVYEPSAGLGFGNPTTAFNSTLWAGDVIKIEFRTSFHVRPGYTESDGGATWFIELVDENDDVISTNPVMPTSGTNFLNGDYDTLIDAQNGNALLYWASQSYDATIGPPNGPNHHAGFVTSNSYTFGRVSGHDLNNWNTLQQTHTIYFNFAETIQETMIAQSFRVRIGCEASGSNSYINAQYTNSPDNIILEKIIIKKLKTLAHPYMEQTPALPQIDPYPLNDIPAWAEVIPNGVLGWNFDFSQNFNTVPNSNFGNTFVQQDTSINPYYPHNQIYGNFNEGEWIVGQDPNGTNVYLYVGEGNGTTAYNQYPVTPGNYNLTIQNPFGGALHPANYPIDSNGISNLTGCNFKMDNLVTGTKYIDQVNSFNWVAGDWYEVVIEVDNSHLYQDLSAVSGVQEGIVVCGVIDHSAGSFINTFAGAATVTRQFGGVFTSGQDLASNVGNGSGGYIPPFYYGDLWAPSSSPALPQGSITAIASPTPEDTLYSATGWANPTHYRAIFQVGANSCVMGVPDNNGISFANQLKLAVFSSSGTNPFEINVTDIKINNISNANYFNGGGNADNWYTNPSNYDQTLNPLHVNWLTEVSNDYHPYPAFYKDNALCFNVDNINIYPGFGPQTQFRPEWKQEFNSANNSNIAPQNPSMDGYTLTFDVEALPLPIGDINPSSSVLSTSIGTKLELTIANNLGDYAAGEHAGIVFSDFVDASGTYSISFNFDDSTPSGTFNGTALPGVNVFDSLHGAGRESDASITNMIRFKCLNSDLKCIIKNIILQDNTIGFGGGTAGAWSLVNGLFDYSQGQDYIYWDSGQEAIVFNEAPAGQVSSLNPNGHPFQITQYIGDIQEFTNPTGNIYYRFSMDINLTGVQFDDGNTPAATGVEQFMMEVYYYNQNGDGFTVYPTPTYTISNGTLNFDIYPSSQSITPNVNYGNIFGIGNPSPTGSAGNSLYLAPALQNTIVINLYGIAGYNFASPILTPYQNAGIGDGALISGTLDNITFYQLPTQNAEGVTVSYKEKTKGWVSFKSFIPESGLSLGSNYYTIKEGKLYEHHDILSDINNFYGQAYNSFVDVVFNDMPSVTKEFMSINYQGSQAKNDFSSDNLIGLNPENFLSNDDYFLETEREGWAVANISSDLEQGNVLNFIKKESLWLSEIRGQDVYAVPYLYEDYSAGENSSFGLGVVEEAVDTNAPQPNVAPAAASLPLPNQPQVQPQVVNLVQPNNFNVNQNVQTPTPSPTPPPTSGGTGGGGGY